MLSTLSTFFSRTENFVLLHHRQKIDCFSWMRFTPVYFFHGWVHVYLFHGQNGSFCNSMCSCLTFLHVCLLNPRIGALSTFSSRSEYFVLLHYKQPSGHFNVESTLNQRQTSTLKQRWNMVGFESWMDVEMTTLNQRRLPDVDSTSGLQRWINVDCLTLNQLHIISIQPSIPTITQHSYATLMQLRMRSSN